MAVREACDGKTLFTVAVAPHQVWGSWVSGFQGFRAQAALRPGSAGRERTRDQGGPPWRGLRESLLAAFPLSFPLAPAGLGSAANDPMRCRPVAPDTAPRCRPRRQVYGPRDMLFLHNFAQSAARLRVFGDGKNKCSLCHVDNYCHGLILGEVALRPGSPALGKFYIVTDGEPQLFWPTIDSAVTAVGCASVYSKFRLPAWFILPLAYCAQLLGALLGRKFKLNTFAARMLMIHRWFDIQAARTDLGYEPVVSFADGWASTVDWFVTVWAPVHGPNRARKQRA